MSFFFSLYVTKEASHPALDSMQDLIQWGSVSAGKVLVAGTLQIPGGGLGCALLTSKVLHLPCVILSCFSIVQILMQKYRHFRN